MSFITRIGNSNIYIGNAKDALDKEFFIKNNISAVVNCTPDVPFLLPENKHPHIRLVLDDSGRQHDINKMTKMLPTVVSWIDKQQKLGHNILVHCHAGIQRSATVVVAYLMAKGDISLRDALSYVHSKRPLVFSFGLQVNFIESLRQFSQFRFHSKPFSNVRRK